MKVEIRNRTIDASSYRAARVKSLFNADSGAEFNLDAELPIEGSDWRIGVVVGPSGSGKTSIGRVIFGEPRFYSPEWPALAPIVDGFSGGAGFDTITGALSAVGLGDVPAWLRPYSVLSNGEQFRATLARLIMDSPAEAVVDEFTSVVDRQIAKIGALAFSKAWRRAAGKVVLLTPHYDVLEWLEPDWVFDTGTKAFSRGGLRRPKIELEILKTDWRYWPLFEPHHYLKAGAMPGGQCFVGLVDGEPVVHLGVATQNKGKSVEARACRLVVMPEWQGAGVGMRFLNWICDNQLRGGEGARLAYPATTSFHTSHPGLCAALRRSPNWTQLSAALHGTTRKGAHERLQKAAGPNQIAGNGYGGHFRAIQGYRYIGERKDGPVRS